MKYKDYYAALGVPREADTDAIKRAYRKLARQHHPDVNKNADAEARFKEVGEAYATLKDPAARAAYDELARRPAGQEFAPPPEWREAYAHDAHAFEDVDLADLLAALARGKGGAFGAKRPVSGRDYEVVARISLEQAHRGTTLTLNVDAESTGTTLEVKVPAGATEGQKLRLRGRGGKGRNGGHDGDIYVHVTLLPHAVFRPDGHDLYMDLALAPWEAALGADVEVPTIDGPVILTVPPGTRSARRLRVKGRGMSTARGHRGDLYAVVHIDVPAVLTPRERELFEDLAKVSTFNPRPAPFAEKPHEASAT